MQIKRNKRIIKLKLQLEENIVQMKEKLNSCPFCREVEVGSEKGGEKGEGGA